MDRAALQIRYQDATITRLSDSTTLHDPQPHAVRSSTERPSLLSQASTRVGRPGAGAAQLPVGDGAGRSEAAGGSTG
jgi:hypothetical protein